jgi:hypothetical protein
VPGFAFLAASPGTGQRQPYKPSLKSSTRDGRILAQSAETSECTTPVALRGKQRAVYASRYPAELGHAFNGETGISRYAAVLLHQEEGAVHPPHGAPVPDRGTGTGGIGLRDLLAGDKQRKWPGAARHTRATFLAYGDAKRPATRRWTAK